MVPFKEFDHPADVGLEIFGADYPTLFRNAAQGFYYLLFKDSAILNHPSNGMQNLELEESSIEELLVSFLSELNYFFLSQKTLLWPFAKLEISYNTENCVLRASAKRIELNSSGIVKNAMEIKAVTYHQLKVEKGKNGFQARVIFDV